MKALFGNGGTAAYRAKRKLQGGGPVSRGARQGGGDGRLFQRRNRRGAAPRSGRAGFVLGRGGAGNGRGRG